MTGVVFCQGIVEVAGVVVVVDGSVNQGVSCCIGCHSGQIALVPLRSDPLRHAVAVNLSDCIKSGGLQAEFHGQS